MKLSQTILLFLLGAPVLAASSGSVMRQDKAQKVSPQAKPAADKHGSSEFQNSQAAPDSPDSLEDAQDLVSKDSDSKNKNKNAKDSQDSDYDPNHLGVSGETKPAKAQVPKVNHDSGDIVPLADKKASASQEQDDDEVDATDSEDLDTDVLVFDDDDADFVETYVELWSTTATTTTTTTANAKATAEPKGKGKSSKKGKGKGKEEEEESIAEASTTVGAQPKKGSDNAKNNKKGSKAIETITTTTRTTTRTTTTPTTTPTTTTSTTTATTSTVLEVDESTIDRDEESREGTSRKVAAYRAQNDPKHAADEVHHETAISLFIGGLIMIVVSEIGDKTFFIAALMAMKYTPLYVFFSSYAAMFVMTVLSMFIGMILPSLLSKNVSTLLATILFLIFGIRLFKEGYHMDKSIKATEDLEEVEQTLAMKESTSASLKAEGGGVYARRNRRVRPWRRFVNYLEDLSSSPWVQIFVMTFLGEWGDRSQIATIAMGAGTNWIPVLLGCLAGHFITTAIAVMGGNLLASKLSLRTVTLSGAFCFLAFAILYFKEWLDLE